MDSWTLLFICGLATYLWRGPGVFISAAVDVKGRVFLWVSCVAYAVIAGLVSRMLLMPTGVLAETTVPERALGSAAALLVFFRLTRRNLFAGVAAGALAVLLLRHLSLAGLL
jgi:branched-subunit amino acid transport protein